MKDVGRALMLLMGVMAPVASAQTVGTVRWQTQPFCNVVTVTVSVAGTALRLEGTDDHCGAPTKASVIGMAFPNADGSFGVGLTIVSPGAAVLHLDATVLLNAGFNGTWHDSVGRTGSWVFTPGAGTGGPARPLVGPLVTYGSHVAQPAGASDRGLSVTVSTDTGTPNDAAGVYGSFGAPTSLASFTSAGVRGESDAQAGVYGLTTSGWGVAGAAQTGIGVVGYGVEASSTGIQAVNLAGGTALEVYNGALRVGGAIRTAFVQTVTTANSNCSWLNHPLVNNDPDVLIFPTLRNGPRGAWAFYDTGFWFICAEGPFVVGERANVLVIKQAP